MVYILGVSSLGDTGAAIAKDGDLIVAVEQERFDGNRHSHAFPGEAIRYCLDEAGITPADLDYIGINYKPILGWPWAPYLIRNLPGSLALLRERLKPKASKFMSVKSELQRLDSTVRINPLMLEHHRLHMASSFYVSPFEESAVLITDAVGEWTSTTLGYGQGIHYETIERVNFPHSLGFFYGAITDYLGFEFGKHEGKTMGLAASGEAVYHEALSKLIGNRKDGRFKIDQSYFTYRYGWHGSPLVSERFCAQFGQRRIPGEEFQPHHLNMAASVQSVLDEVLIEIAQYLYKKTRSKNLCLAGGVALNCVTNSRILEEVPFENMYIPPAANDAGTAVGAIYQIHNGMLGNPRTFQMDHAYWGPHYTDEQVEKVLIAMGCEYRRATNICRETAQLIKDGRTVGWFQGRMEFGPRSLGNRSILADPRDKTVKDRINSTIKFREKFRPFAPAILEHRIGDYFTNTHLSPFMLQSFQIHEPQQLEIPGVTHTDGSGRLQTVNSKSNPLFFKLIQEFEDITGVPVLLNTSLNIRGEPIARTPEDALHCYINSGLNVLVLGNYILKKH